MSTMVTTTRAADTGLVMRARLFATRHHGAIGQTRKYTGEPYIVHPAAVAKIVSSVAHTQEMLAAAWLHDTVEDTNATLEEVRDEFGEVVAELVEMLTAVSRPEDGNRATRKAMDHDHSAEASPSAQTVKLGDILHNCEFILDHDIDFANVYLREKALLLRVLTKGDAALLQRAIEVVRSGLEEIERRMGAGERAVF